MAPFDAKEQWLYSELPADIRPPYPQGSEGKKETCAGQNIKLKVKICILLFLPLCINQGEINILISRNIDFSLINNLGARTACSIFIFTGNPVRPPPSVACFHMHVIVILKESHIQNIFQAQPMTNHVNVFYIKYISEKQNT